MELSLKLSYQEQNDNKAIILTDGSNWNFKSGGSDNLVNGETTSTNVMYQIISRATYDFTIIGAANNLPGTRFIANAAATLGSGDSLMQVTPKVTEIISATLDTTVIKPDNTSSVKPQINLLSEFGPFNSTTDLVFTITSGLLGEAADEELIDGIYDIKYIIKYKSGGTGLEIEKVLDTMILVYGKVKVAVYEQLRDVPNTYMLNEASVDVDLFEAALSDTYLSAIEASAYVAKTEELLSMISTLENIVKNGSKVVW